ncbi:hypothetical protein [Cryptosporangium sp. NPDC048952]|uniref:hypothetical protein n=1 Tax=Cryptosporangium sp. NPDC048952 TaxID=3363961 RepID=UPI0037159ECA
MSRYGWIRTSLSGPRFAPYLQACVNSYDRAIDLYWWNVDASAGFYAPLHCLEVGLRNALHGELARYYHRADWWTVCSPGAPGERMLRDAHSKTRVAVAVDGQAGQGGSDDIVAALPFGFWVSLLSRRNEVQMWRPALHRAFRPLYRGPRGDLHQHLDHLRLFRNRVMHHEPIHHRDLHADRRRIYELVNYLSPDLGRELAGVDRLSEILARFPLAPIGGNSEP